jgi:hypothetical protein
MKESFTRKEVHQILVGLMVFSGANNDQGLKKIYGRAYGEQADHVLACADQFDEQKQSGIITMVGKLRHPLEPIDESTLTYGIYPESNIS